MYEGSRGCRGGRCQAGLLEEDKKEKERGRSKAEQSAGIAQEGRFPEKSEVKWAAEGSVEE